MRVSPSNINAFLYTPNKYFDIPDFQRPYSWEASNIQSFLEDLERTMENGRSHYFGSVVYIVSGKESTIIDGQQRATTVLLMITSIYHMILEHPKLSDMSSGEINENFLFNKYGDVDNRIKLRTVTVDDQIFKKIYEKKALSPSEKDSRLYKAYKLFCDYLANKKDLHKYIEALERFEIVDISLEPTDDDPQKIFESINSTGRPLSDGDRIRNFALMLNDKEARKYVFENYWQDIERKLTYVSQDYVTDFFKNYLTSHFQQDVKLEQVYPAFKRLFADVVGEDQSNIELLQQFYDPISVALSHYLLLKFNAQPDDEAYEFISLNAFRLNFLKIETPYAFLLKVLERYTKQQLSQQEVIEIFNVLESYLARRIICNTPTTGLNKLFATMDKDIRSYQEESPGASYVSVFEYILLDKANQLRFPRKKELQSVVPTNPFYSQRNYYINFVLSSVDDLGQSKESSLLNKLSESKSGLSIEHIMPQTLTAKWIDELGEAYEEIHSQYVHTLPNLTLTGYNSKYSNRSFEEKKTIENGFNDSPLIINQPIKSEEHWDKSALLRRTDWWINKIEKLWPVPRADFVPPKTDSEISLLEDRDLLGTKVKSVQVLGDVSNVSTWSQVVEIITERLFEQFPDLWEKIIEDEFISRYIVEDSSGLLNPAEINNTGLYLETGTNTNYKRMLVEKLAGLTGLKSGDITVELVKSRSGVAQSEERSDDASVAEDRGQGQIVEEAVITTSDGRRHRLIRRESGQIQVLNADTGLPEKGHTMMRQYIDENGLDFDYKVMNTRTLGKKLLEYLSKQS